MDGLGATAHCRIRATTLHIDDLVHHRVSRDLAIWLVLLGVAAVAASWVVFSIHVDAREARRVALLELQAQLDSGERVERWAPAATRHWWDYYRPTHGVLAATDRRLIFVGVAPRRYPEPGARPDYEVRAFPYDTVFDLSITHAELGLTPALLVRQGEATARFTIPRAQRPRLVAVADAARRHDFAVRERLRRERRYRDSLAALPPIRTYYHVRRGDALDAIARRYGTTAEVLRTLNDLPGDRIVVGQQLLVRVAPVPVTPCPPAICDVSAMSAGEIAPETARTKDRRAP